MNKWVKFLIAFTTIVALDVLLDTGKWAIGRYTTITPLISILILIISSSVLAIIANLVQKLRGSKKYTQYLHHGTSVWVRCDLKGKYWEPTLCLDCQCCRPQTAENCVIAESVFTLCKAHSIALAVWGCPNFNRLKSDSIENKR